MVATKASTASNLPSSDRQTIQPIRRARSVAANSAESASHPPTARAIRCGAPERSSSLMPSPPPVPRGHERDEPPLTAEPSVRDLAECAHVPPPRERADHDPRDPVVELLELRSIGDDPAQEDRRPLLGQRAPRVE